MVDYAVESTVPKSPQKGTHNKTPKSPVIKQEMLTKEAIMNHIWEIGMTSKYPPFKKIGLILDGALVDHNNSYTYKKFEYFLDMILKDYQVIKR